MSKIIVDEIQKSGGAADVSTPHTSYRSYGVEITITALH